MLEIDRWFAFYGTRVTSRLRNPRFLFVVIYGFKSSLISVLHLIVLANSGVVQIMILLLVVPIALVEWDVRKSILGGALYGGQESTSKISESFGAIVNINLIHWPPKSDPPALI